MSERNILAYFKTPDQAQQAAAQLKSLGISDVQVDRFSKYPGGSADRLMNPLTGQVSSLSDLTLGDISARDIGVLTAADVSASGMSNGGETSVSGRNVLVAAIVEDSLYDQAIQIVRTSGGLA
ncbi:MAG: hypothetical protein ACYCV0_15875 [Desulfitobacteriaceae bacterium]